MHVSDHVPHDRMTALAFDAASKIPDDMADARYDLIPLDVDMALILPPPEDYTNHHPGVLQLTEIRDPDMPIDRHTGMVRTRETLLGTPGKEAYR